MRAYAVNIFCEPVEPVDYPDRAPEGTEVIIDVTRCGVCHTDLHLQDGYYDLGGGNKAQLRDRGILPPIVLGHEVLGGLTAIGPDAKIAQSEIGKTFLVYPWIGCGTCQACARGDEHLCPKPASIGVFRRGGYAERCVVPDPRYLVDVSGIEPTIAATYACSGLTAYSALSKVDIDRKRDPLLIMGAGGVGLSAVAIARALGFENIAVADIDSEKHELALKTGASAAFDPRDQAAVARIFGEPASVAAIVDFVGSAVTAEFAFKTLRKGGTYVAVGLFGGSITIPLPPLVQRALTFRGSYTGSLRELKEVIELVRTGKVSAIPVEEVAFSEVNTALDRLRRGSVQGRLVLARQA